MTGGAREKVAAYIAAKLAVERAKADLERARQELADFPFRGRSDGGADWMILTVGKEIYKFWFQGRGYAHPVFRAAYP